MKRNVKLKREPRRYDSSRRQAAASETRQRILVAAREEFLEHGYAATTMGRIAERADVAVDTIYATIGPKPELVRYLIEMAISGQDGPVAPDARDYVLEIRAEPDPSRKLARYAQAARHIQGRIAPLFQLLSGDAARADPKLASLWDEISRRRAANMRLFIGDVAASGCLRDDISQEAAADIVWATSGPEMYLLLVRDRGWTPAQFERWLTDTWTRQFLRQPAPRQDMPERG